MKKTISGKKYDTETAELIAEYNNGLSYSDFRNIQEGLYRTKKGEFFLAGHGGAMTKYSAPCENDSRIGGENIFPLSADEAKDWVERRANERYEEIFGEVE